MWVFNGRCWSETSGKLTGEGTVKTVTSSGSEKVTDLSDKIRSEHKTSLKIQIDKL